MQEQLGDIRGSTASLLNVKDIAASETSVPQQVLDSVVEGLARLSKLTTARELPVLGRQIERVSDSWVLLVGQAPWWVVCSVDCDSDIIGGGKPFRPWQMLMVTAAATQQQLQLHRRSQHLMARRKLDEDSNQSSDDENEEKSQPAKTSRAMEERGEELVGLRSGGAPQVAPPTPTEVTRSTRHDVATPHQQILST